jgi:hypothetical protein
MTLLNSYNLPRSRSGFRVWWTRMDCRLLLSLDVLRCSLGVSLWWWLPVASGSEFILCVWHMASTLISLQFGNCLQKYRYFSLTDFGQNWGMYSFLSEPTMGVGGGGHIFFKFISGAAVLTLVFKHYLLCLVADTQTGGWDLSYACSPHLWSLNIHTRRLTYKLGKMIIFYP